jgi:hypothetical protein
MKSETNILEIPSGTSGLIVVPTALLENNIVS